MKIWSEMLKISKKQIRNNPKKGKATSKNAQFYTRYFGQNVNSSEGRFNCIIVSYNRLHKLINFSNKMLKKK